MPANLDEARVCRASGAAALGMPSAKGDSHPTGAGENRAARDGAVHLFAASISRVLPRVLSGRLAGLRGVLNRPGPAIEPAPIGTQRHQQLPTKRSSLRPQLPAGSAAETLSHPMPSRHLPRPPARHQQISDRLDLGSSGRAGSRCLSEADGPGPAATLEGCYQCRKRGQVQVRTLARRARNSWALGAQVSVSGLSLFVGMKENAHETCRRV